MSEYVLDKTANIQQKKQFNDTIINQGIENDKQEKVWLKERIENRFFELLKIQRMNVAEFQLKGKSGRAVVIEMYDEFNKLLEKVCRFLKFELMEKFD